MKRFFSLMLCAVAALLASCANMVGGGDDFPNSKVSGTMLNADLTHAARTMVCLVPVSYDPVGDYPLPFSNFDTTDAEGNYGFSIAGAGRYNIIARHLDSGTRTFIGSVLVADDTIKVNVPVATLQPPGAVRITQRAITDTVNGYMYLPGTLSGRFCTSSGGSIVMDSLPAGTLPDICYAIRGTTGSTTVRYHIVVSSDDTIADPGWGNARAIGLNTTSSGAQVAGSVTDFPALVRLTGDNFDFASATSGGADLYFTKPDNTPLPFEIERWDAGKELAEVWVLVDTVQGNNSVQHFMMYWGSSSSASRSNGASVFGSANGFQGVWHLGESSSTLYDATANGFNGAGNGAQSMVSGMIGNGQSLVDSGAYTDLGNVLNIGAANITVSAWIKRAVNISAATYTIIGKTNGDNIDNTIEPDYGWLLAMTDGYLRFFCASRGKAWGDTGTFRCESGVRITDLTEWHHVAAVIDRSSSVNCKLYIDGADVTNSRTGDITQVGSVNNALTMRIGEEADNEFPFRGYIDESTVSFTARSVDWIKLCYMNQRRDNALVEFR